MAEDYVTPAELEATLAAHGIAKGEKGVTTSAEVQKQIDAAVSAHKEQIAAAAKKKKEEEDAKEEQLFADWKWRIPTELNGLKSEFTSFKAEIVPMVTGWAIINAAFPSLFSLEERLMGKHKWSYTDSGWLQTPGMEQRRHQRTLNRAYDEAMAEEVRRSEELAHREHAERRRLAEEQRRNPPAGQTPP
ncbi:hypothetical protein C6N75_27275, partial [Streptomyces solincola]